MQYVYVLLMKSNLLREVFHSLLINQINEKYLSQCSLRLIIQLNGLLDIVICNFSLLNIIRWYSPALLGFHNYTMWFYLNNYGVYQDDLAQLVVRKDQLVKTEERLDMIKALCVLALGEQI